MKKKKRFCVQGFFNPELLKENDEEKILKYLKKHDQCCLQKISSFNEYSVFFLAKL